MDSHTGAAMFGHAKGRLLLIIGDCWTTKLLYGATDRVRSMTGCLQGPFMGFDKTVLPRFFRIWSTAHQLDLVVHHLIGAALWESLREPLLRTIPYFL